jgi:hypothetical protein
MRRDADDEQRRTLLERGIPQRDIGRSLGIPRSALQEQLKRLQVVPVHRGTPAVIPHSGPRGPEVLWRGVAPERFAE